jgi:poly-gamma-glutamate capsule biosynthesis protein CapA/YwtB (metallophosphatase superfamily)
MLRSILLIAALARLQAGEIVIHAVGDVMPGAGNPSAVPQDLFDAIPQLQGADLLFGNFEGSVSDDASLARPCKGRPGTCFRFVMPTEAVRLIGRTGFDVVNIGNNHAGDAGPGSIPRTIQAVESNSSVCVTGVQERQSCLVTSKSGVKIAVAGFSPHEGSMRAVRDNVVETVRAAKRTAQIVVVSFHIGAEGLSAQHVTKKEEWFLGDSRGNVYDVAHAAIDAGADLVVGHGPHCLRAIELYKGRLIVYSMGNFATNGTFSLDGNLKYGALYQIRLSDDGALKRCRIVSTVQNKTAAPPHIITPAVDPEGNAYQLIRQLTMDDFQGGRLRFVGTDEVEPADNGGSNR